MDDDYIKESTFYEYQMQIIFQLFYAYRRILPPASKVRTQLRVSGTHK
jgi:hypothetical protein